MEQSNDVEAVITDVRSLDVPLDRWHELISDRNGCYHL